MKASSRIIQLDTVKTAELAPILPSLVGSVGVKHVDSWYNALVGLGKSMDKSNKTFFGDFVFMDRNQLSRMYVGDGIGRRIVDIVADDMTREGIEIDMEDEEQKELLEDTLKKLKAEVYFNEALKWERLFGGAVIVIGAMDGQSLDVPLVIEKARSIEWLKVVDMWDVDLPSSEWDRDPTSATYGQIIRYMCQFRVSGTGRIDRMMVHNTRVLPFYGENIPKSLVMGDQRTRYWGASTLQSIWEQLANMGGSMQTVVNLIYEFTIGKYKFNNLAEMLAAGNEDKLIKRMQIISMSKSMINGVMLGKDDEYIRESANVFGLSDLIDRIMMLLAGCSSIPVTRLFGRSPAGMNATGESDLSTYYDMVRAKQKTDLQPNLQKFITMLATVLKFKGSPHFKFNPLRQSTPKEQAEIDHLVAQAAFVQAQADQIYIMNQVVSPEEIALEREFITEEQYSILRGSNPEEAATSNAEAALKAKPSEGSSLGTPNVREKNMVEVPGKEGKSVPLKTKMENAAKQTATAAPPADNPGQLESVGKPNRPVEQGKGKSKGK